jgi:hypothetical protein
MNRSQFQQVYYEDCVQLYSTNNVSFLWLACFTHVLAVVTVDLNSPHG